MRFMSAALIPPSAGLADLIKAYVVRSTFDQPMPACGWRLSRYPAMTFCGLTFLLRGEACWLPLDVDLRQDALTPAHPRLRTTPPIFVNGPLTRPLSGIELTPVETVTLAFYAPAFHAFSGTRPDALRDCPAEDPALLGDWVGTLRQALLDEPDTARRVACIEAFLTPRWAATRDRLDRRWLDAGQLLSRVGVRAAALWLRWSARSLERQIERSYGIAPRDVRKLHRAQDAFLAARDANRADLATLAAEHGYTDQSHLSRDISAMSGEPPKRLLDKVKSDDDSFWVYRL